MSDFNEFPIVSEEDKVFMTENGVDDGGLGRLAMSSNTGKIHEASSALGQEPALRPDRSSIGSVGKVIVTAAMLSFKQNNLEINTTQPDLEVPPDFDTTVQPIINKYPGDN